MSHICKKIRTSRIAVSSKISRYHQTTIKNNRHNNRKCRLLLIFLKEAKKICKDQTHQDPSKLEINFERYPHSVQSNKNSWTLSLMKRKLTSTWTSSSWQEKSYFKPRTLCDKDFNNLISYIQILQKVLKLAQ